MTYCKARKRLQDAVTGSSAVVVGPVSVCLNRALGLILILRQWREVGMRGGCRSVGLGRLLLAVNGGICRGESG